MTVKNNDNSMTLTDLAARLNARLIGEGSVIVVSVGSLGIARPDQLSFVSSDKYAENAKRSQAGAILVHRQIENVAAAQLIVDSVDISLIEALKIFAPRLTPAAGIHPSAVVEDSAVIGRNVEVGPFAYVSHNVKIGDNCIISAGCKVCENVKIGKNTNLDCNVVIYRNCRIGDNCTILANTTIGSTGFGYALLGGKHQLIPHNGAVIIEDCVEIGANTCIDRAKFDNTIIGAGTKIDNLVQIAHNVVIGKCCLLAGQSGIAGSTVIGDGVVLAGQSGIIDNVKIGSRVIIAGKSSVVTSIDEGKMYWGSPAIEISEQKKAWACFRKLPKMAKDIRNIAKKVSEIETAENDKK